MGGNETDWYLAQLKPNGAQLALRNLARQGFSTFFPQDQETQRRGDKFVTTLRPVFPGYIFVAIDSAQGAWRAVNATRGITRLVSFGREPCAVPAALIEQLRQRFDQTGPAPQPDTPKAGETVRLATGPFAGFLAEIEQVEPDRRVWVLMDVMGQKTRVAAHTAQLRPA